MDFGNDECMFLDKVYATEVTARKAALKMMNHLGISMNKLNSKLFVDDDDSLYSLEEDDFFIVEIEVVE